MKYYRVIIIDNITGILENLDRDRKKYEARRQMALSRLEKKMSSKPISEDDATNMWNVQT